MTIILAQLSNGINIDSIIFSYVIFWMKSAVILSDLEEIGLWPNLTFGEHYV